MKKLFLTLLVITAITPVFAQTDLAVNLCGNTENITKNQLLACLEIQTNTEGWKIESFTFSVKVNDVITEVVGTGNKISERMLFLINKFSPEKIYLEKFILTNGEIKSDVVKPLILLVSY
ncbi:MAG: hypothetical protein COX70_07115 [Flavobacteriales bacterium CG_4_10_14_0_2_um_filter_32_8]|nr:MAG: hypothetical protein COX70_07115 [Flavobacteriales bacterium CG_4_10_14_0_2_um_filter_32_8]